MHRQGKTELFDDCPICKEHSEECRRINVRDGVWFTCCPKCFTGIRTFMQKVPGSSRHPAEGKSRRRWPEHRK